MSHRFGVWFLGSLLVIGLFWAGWGENAVRPAPAGGGSDSLSEEASAAVRSPSERAEVSVAPPATRVESPAAEPRTATPTERKAAFAAKLANDPTVELALDRESVERLQLATARFDLGVAEGEFRADDLAPEIVHTFEGVELEPVLGDDGTILGLEVESVETGNPLAAAGLEPGDRITELGGNRLGDPAELPAILVGLEGTFQICADRGGTSYCRDVRVD